MSKKVLVTGAAGFVGSVLVRRLVKEGYFVHAFIKENTKKWRIHGLEKNMAVYDIDLIDALKVKNAISAIKPDIIFHLATRGAYSTQSDADNIFQTNVVGTWNLLRAAANNEFELFVNTGSSSEYGFKNKPMCETDVLQPNSYYSATKGSQTLLCQQFSKSENLPITTLRLFSVYGSYEEPSRLIPVVVKKCLKNEPVELSSPDIGRDFIHIDDVVDAYMMIDKLKEFRGEIFNIGTGIQGTIRDIFYDTKTITVSTSEPLWNSIPPKSWDAKVWVADCSKANAILGWKAKTERLFAGLENTVGWWKENRAYW